MSRRYIDFISAYCDRWCERCEFTQRCSAFAVKTAAPTCDGNESAALDLAIGPPRTPGAPPANLHERMADATRGVEQASEKEVEAIGGEVGVLRERIRRTGLARASSDYAVAAQRWLAGRDYLRSVADLDVRRAVEIVAWDAHLIPAKIMRALSGRDQDPLGRIWRSRVQNDWNGSAKVALISIERSERAWRLIATATRDDAGIVLAGALARLRSDTLREFPRVMAFRRPGFDDRASGEPRM